MTAPQGNGKQSDSAADAMIRAAVKVFRETGDRSGVERLAGMTNTTPEALIAAVDLDDALASPVMTGNPKHSLIHEPRIVSLADVEAQPVRWLWPARIALGKLTIFAGDPGTGKSILSLDLASRVSTGAGWPDAPSERHEPGGVVLLGAEDALDDTVRPRLDAAGADVSKIMAMQGVMTRDAGTGATVERAFTLADVPALESALKRTPGCKLVIVDPISAFMGGADSHVNAEVRAALAPLSALAEKHGVAVVAVTHLRKGEGNAIYRAMGSLAFVAAARAAWAVVKDKDIPERRLFVPIKNNIGSDRDGLAFDVRNAGNGIPCIAWHRDPVTTTADEALAPPAKTPGPEPEARATAIDYLRGALAGGARLAAELIEEAREVYTISKSTLDRARSEMGVEAFRTKIPGPWYWRLPASQHRQPATDAAGHEGLGDLGDLENNTGESNRVDG